MSYLESAGLEEIAKATRLNIDEVKAYADRGWFDKEEDGFCKGDSIWRCALIDHLEKNLGYSEQEIDGIIRHLDTAGLARMGGWPKVARRYAPFEQELAKAGACWICAGLGKHSPDASIRFVVHGQINPDALDYKVIRTDDGALLRSGEAEIFEILGKTYAHGIVEPGLFEGSYRIYFGGCSSYEFEISENARADYVALGLRYFRGTRCGEETEFHPACHLDDGIRDDTGNYYPLVGGWHDAGDLCHIFSTTRASYYLAKALETAETSFPCLKDLYDEAMHGADYNLRARDAQTGQVFVGKGVGAVGGFHGVFPDSFRFTDNIICSGDERRINTGGKSRAEVTAWECLSSLAVMSREHNGEIPRFREACLDAAEKGWLFHESAKTPSSQSPLSSTAKRLICALEWHKTTGADKWLSRADAQLELFVASIDDDGDFVEEGGRLFEFYQWGGQLLLALALTMESKTALADKARKYANKTADRLVSLAKLHPYGITCYSITKDEHIPTYTIMGTTNRWHPLENGKSYRLYQPYTTLYHVHGSVKPISITAVGLAVLGKAIGRDDYIALARRHWDWCMGLNPYQACMTSSWGTSQAAPLSPAVGYMPGGTYTGLIGDKDDEPYFQVGKGMRLGEEPLFHMAGPSATTREYWTALGAALIWLRLLFVE